MTTTIASNTAVSASGITAGAIEFEPTSTPTPGNILIAVIDSRSDTPEGLLVFGNPVPAAVEVLPGGSPLYGWDAGYMAIQTSTRVVQVFYAPAHNIDDYLTFPLLMNADTPDSSTEVSARLYEVNSSLGRIFGIGSGYSDRRQFETSYPLSVHASPWIAAPTGYSRSGSVFCIGAINSTTGGGVIDLDFSEPVSSVAPPTSEISTLYGEYAFNQSAEATVSYSGGPYTAGVLVMQLLVMQSDYETVQFKQASASTVTLDTAPTIDNVLIASTASPEVLSLEGWELVTRQGDGVASSTFYRRVTADNLSPTVSIPGATEISLSEVSGFPDGVRLGVSATLATTNDAVGFGSDEGGGASNTVFTPSLPDNDGYFYASLAFEGTPPDSVSLYPEAFLVEPSNLLSSGEGWDFYPDGGYPVGITGSFSSEATVAGTGLILYNDNVVPPEPPKPPTFSYTACPKSIRACALRFTRLNQSKVPLDPLTPKARIQTAAFAELNLTPDIESGSEVVTRTPDGNSIAIIDRTCDILKGMNLDLKVCGVPMSMLEILTGASPLMDEATITGGALRDGFDSGCVDMVMVELWSRNVASIDPDNGLPVGKWIHWLIPCSMKWSISGSVAFSNGPLEISLTGYAVQNEAWYPSLPSSLFNSYIPGNGNPDGYPTGTPGAVTPDGVVVDSWIPSDMAVIRNSGPLAWKVVDSLPAPLDDCDYMDVNSGPCDVSLDFCDSAGGVLGAPWVAVEIPDPPLTCTGNWGPATEYVVPFEDPRMIDVPNTYDPLVVTPYGMEVDPDGYTYGVKTYIPDSSVNPYGELEEAIRSSFEVPDDECVAYKATVRMDELRPLGPDPFENLVDGELGMIGLSLIDTPYTRATVSITVDPDDSGRYDMIWNHDNGNAFSIYNGLTSEIDSMPPVWLSFRYVPFSRIIEFSVCHTIEPGQPGSSAYLYSNFVVLDADAAVKAGTCIELWTNGSVSEFKADYERAPMV